ncbi:MAG: hypothetical protein RR296_09750 [Clostridia bacterium]
MTTRVYYVSPKGSAEKIAGAIARAVKCACEPLLPAYMPENVGIMFLGCEGTKADKVTLDFISVLNPDRVARAALFHCGKDANALGQMRAALINPDRVTHTALFHCGKDANALGQMRAALTQRGIEVLDMTLSTPLKGMFGGRPTDADCARATLFALDCMQFLSATPN